MKINFRNLCEKYDFDKDMFSDKFRKKLKKYNEILDQYLPGKKEK